MYISSAAGITAVDYNYYCNDNTLPVIHLNFFNRMQLWSTIVNQTTHRKVHCLYNALPISLYPLHIHL